MRFGALVARHLQADRGIAANEQRSTLIHELVVHVPNLEASRTHDMIVLALIKDLVCAFAKLGVAYVSVT